MRKQVLSLLVENTSGVLSHISGLFSRRRLGQEAARTGLTGWKDAWRLMRQSSG